MAVFILHRHQVVKVNGKDNMNNFFALESKLAELTPKKRKQAEILLDLVKKVIDGEEPSTIRSPEDVYHLLASELLSLEQEHFIVLMLNAKNRIILKETISIGTINATVVHPRDIFRTAILKNAAGIICVHNHPSGDPTPSQQDIELTKGLFDVGGIMGIEIIDHIIIALDGYVSLREQGLM